MAFTPPKRIRGDLGVRERYRSVLTERADSQISGLGDSVSLLGRESDTSQNFSVVILSFFFSQCRNMKFSKARFS